MQSLGRRDAQLQRAARPQRRAVAEGRGERRERASPMRRLPFASPPRAPPSGRRVLVLWLAVGDARAAAPRLARILALDRAAPRAPPMGLASISRTVCGEVLCTAVKNSRGVFSYVINLSGPRQLAKIERVNTERSPR